jgi:hypothetical protein
MAASHLRSGAIDDLAYAGDALIGEAKDRWARLALPLFPWPPHGCGYGRDLLLELFLRQGGETTRPVRKVLVDAGFGQRCALRKPGFQITRF